MAEVVKTLVVPERTYTEVVHKCDICGKEGPFTDNHDMYGCVRYIVKCSICGTEVCAECSHYTSGYHHEWHSWTSVYCKNCWKKGEKYIARVDKAAGEFDDFIDAEMAKWREECVVAGEQRTPANR